MTLIRLFVGIHTLSSVNEIMFFDYSILIVERLTAENRCVMSARCMSRYKRVEYNVHLSLRYSYELVSSIHLSSFYVRESEFVKNDFFSTLVGAWNEILVDQKLTVSP